MISCRLRTADQQYWLRGDTNQIFGDTSKQQSAKSAPAMGAYHYQIRIPILGFLLDGLGNPPIGMMDRATRWLSASTPDSCAEVTASNRILSPSLRMDSITAEGGNGSVSIDTYTGVSSQT
jgi:hypothetical protein